MHQILTVEIPLNYRKKLCLKCLPKWMRFRSPHEIFAKSVHQSSCCKIPKNYDKFLLKILTKIHAAKFPHILCLENPLSYWEKSCLKSLPKFMLRPKCVPKFMLQNSPKIHAAKIPQILCLENPPKNLDQIVYQNSPKNYAQNPFQNSCCKNPPNFMP